MPPTVLYFDLGKVLLSFSHERMCEQMAHVASVSAEVVNAAIFGNDEALAAQWQYESGQITTEQYFDYFCRATGTHPDRQQLAEAVCDIFAPIDETWVLVQRLAAAGNRLAILSNTNPVQWEFITAGRFPLLANIGDPGGAFAWSVLSYEARSMKPDRAIYEAALKRAGGEGGDIFFVDDRPENVAGALEAGIDAVQFFDAERLALELRQRQVAGA